MDWDRTMITLKLKRLINYHPPQKNQNNPTYKLIQTRTKIISIKGENGSIYKDLDTYQQNPRIRKQIFSNNFLCYQLQLEQVELATQYFNFEGN